jgi:hypothetical protein
MANGGNVFDPNDPMFGPLGGLYGGITTGSPYVVPGMQYQPGGDWPSGTTTDQGVGPQQPVGDSGGGGGGGALSGQSGGGLLSGLGNFFTEGGGWRQTAAALGGALLAGRGNLGPSMQIFGQQVPQLQKDIQRRQLLNAWMKAKSSGDKSAVDAAAKQIFQTNPDLVQSMFQYSMFPRQKKLSYNPVTGQAVLSDEYGNVTDLSGDPISSGTGSGAVSSAGGGAAGDTVNIGGQNVPLVPLGSLAKPEKISEDAAGNTIYRGYDQGGKVGFARGPTGKTDPQQMQYQGVADRLQTARDTIAANMGETLRRNWGPLGSSDSFLHSLQNPDDPNPAQSISHSLMSPAAQKYYGAGEELARAARTIDTARNITPKTSEQYQAEYMPSWDDSPARRQQKLEAIDALIKEVRGMGGQPAGGGGQPQPPAETPATQPTGAAAGAGKPSQTDAINQAKQAIQAGKDPTAVRQRLIELGYDVSGL